MPNQAAIDAINAKKAEYIAAVGAAETAMQSLKTALGAINAAATSLSRLEAGQVGIINAHGASPGFEVMRIPMRISQRITRALDTMPNQYQTGNYGIVTWPTEQSRAENWVSEETVIVNNSFSWLLGKLAA